MNTVELTLNTLWFLFALGGFGVLYYFIKQVIIPLFRCKTWNDDLLDD